MLAILGAVILGSAIYASMALRLDTQGLGAIVLPALFSLDIIISSTCYILKFIYHTLKTGGPETARSFLLKSVW
jgi:hypothetical protein